MDALKYRLLLVVESFDRDENGKMHRTKEAEELGYYPVTLVYSTDINHVNEARTAIIEQFGLKD